MSKPQLMPIAYKINDNFTLRGFRWVHGYAIDSGLGVNIAAHIRDTGKWVCDHWETGFCFGGEHDSLDECVKNGIREMRKRIKRGEYEKALAKAIEKTRVAA